MHAQTGPQQQHLKSTFHDQVCLPVVCVWT